MALGSFIKIIQTAKKAADMEKARKAAKKQELEIKKKAAEERKSLKEVKTAKQGEASAVQNASDLPQVSKREQDALAENKKKGAKALANAKKGNIFVTIASACLDFIEAIPVVILTAKFVAILVVVIIVITLIIGFINAITTAIVDTSTTVLVDQAFNFENAFDVSFANYTDSVGVRHNTIKMTIPDDDDDDDPDPNPDPIIITLDDIDFWLQLSDADIEAFLVNDITDYNAKVYATNMFRFVRMAYRICYTKDEKGEYYLKGIDPQLLLGLPFFEKGYSWMQLDTQSGLMVPVLVEDGGSEAGTFYESTWWTVNADSTWSKTVIPKDLDTGELKAGSIRDGHLKAANIDTSISGGFIVNPVAGSGYAYNNCDGPTSWSIAKEYWERGEHTAENIVNSAPTYFHEVFESKVTSKYKDYLFALLEYPEYAPLKVLVNEDMTLNDPDHYLVGSLFFSWILTAVQYDTEWYDGTMDSTFAKRVLQLHNYNSAEPDFKVLGFSSNTDFKNKYDNALEYYLCKLRGVADISAEDMASYTRAVACCTYYTYHHMPYFAKDTGTNYAYARIGGITGEEDISTFQRAVDKYDSTWRSFYSALGLSITMILEQADGYIGNYVLEEEMPEETDPTTLPFVTYNTLMVTSKAGYSGTFFDGRISYTWEDGLEPLFEAVKDAAYYYEYKGETYELDAHWSLRTGENTFSRMDTSILGDAITRYNNVLFDNGMSLTELLMPLNIEAISLVYDGEQSYSNMRAQIAEGPLAPLIGSLLANRAFACCADRIVMTTKPDDPIIVVGDAPLGAWIWSKSNLYSVYDIYEGKASSITECSIQNSMFPFIDDDFQSEGIQSTFGSTGHISAGSGGYSAANNHHASFDFAISPGQTNVNLDGYYFIESTRMFEYVSYKYGFEDMRVSDPAVLFDYSGYNMDYTPYDSYRDRCAAIYSPDMSYNAYEARIPMYAIADGVVKSITYNVFSDTGSSGVNFGNCLVVEHYLPSAASDAGYETIEIIYSHLSSDLGHIWADYIYKYDQTCPLANPTKTIAVKKGGYRSVGTGMDFNGTSQIAGVPDTYTAYTVTLPNDGVYIKRGTFLGYTSMTGMASGPHYHGEIDGTEDDSGTPDYGKSYAKMFGLLQEELKVYHAASSYDVAPAGDYYPMHRRWFEIFESENPGSLGSLANEEPTLQWFVDNAYVYINGAETDEIEDST